MRFIVSVFATVAMIFAATAASASVDMTVNGVIISSAGGVRDGLATNVALAGDIVQVDIFLNNTDAGLDTIVGASFAAGVAGGGLGNLTLLGGTTSAEYFSTGLGKFGGNLNGVINGDGTPNGTDGAYTSIKIPNSLSPANITLSGNVRFFSAFLINGDGSGAFDYGTNDTGGSPGGTPNVDVTGLGNAAHARMFFQVGVGDVNLEFGQSVDDSLTLLAGGVGVINGTSITIGTVIPEPGTALLMGLGLSGLSMAGRRRKA